MHPARRLCLIFLESSGDKGKSRNPRWKSGVSVTRPTHWRVTTQFCSFLHCPQEEKKWATTLLLYYIGTHGWFTLLQTNINQQGSAHNQTNSSLEMQALLAWQLFIFTARMFVCTWRRANAHLLFSSEETPLGADFWNHARMLMSALCHIVF